MSKLKKGDMVRVVQLIGEGQYDENEIGLVGKVLNTEDNLNSEFPISVQMPHHTRRYVYKEEELVLVDPNDEPEYFI